MCAIPFRSELWILTKAISCVDIRAMWTNTTHTSSRFFRGAQFCRTNGHLRVVFLIASGAAEENVLKSWYFEIQVAHRLSYFCVLSLARKSERFWEFYSWRANDAAEEWFPSIRQALVEALFMFLPALFARFHVEPDRQEGLLRLKLAAPFSKIINQQVQFTTLLTLLTVFSCLHATSRDYQEKHFNLEIKSFTSSSPFELFFFSFIFAPLWRVSLEQKLQIRFQILRGSTENFSFSIFDAKGKYSFYWVQLTRHILRVWEMFYFWD